MVNSKLQTAIDALRAITIQKICMYSVIISYVNFLRKQKGKDVVLVILLYGVWRIEKVGKVVKVNRVR